MTKVSKTAELSRELRKALGNKTQAELAAVLLVSRNYISQIEASLKKPSERLEQQMQRLLTEAADTHKVSAREEPGDYGNLRNKSPRGAPAEAFTNQRMVNPRHALGQQSPTAEECRAYFETYLESAAKEKGGLGYTWKILHKHFPLDDFEPEKKGQ